MKKHLPDSCPVVRRYRVRHYTLNGATGDSAPTYEGWVTAPCGTPLFGNQKTIGKCRACAAGWTHEHNYPVGVR